MRGGVRRWNASRERQWHAPSVKSLHALPGWAGVPVRLQSLESSDADEERLRAIETSQTSVHSGVEVKNAGDSDALTVSASQFGVLGICISGGEVLGSG